MVKESLILSYSGLDKDKPIQISREDSDKLMEEMGESDEYVCPRCNGIIIYKINKDIITKHPLPRGKEHSFIKCGECGKSFTVYPVKNTIRGEVAKFVFLNLDLFSKNELSQIIRQKFSLRVTEAMVSNFIKKAIKLKLNYPKYPNYNYGGYTLKEAGK